MKSLNEREKLFCAYYVSTRNCTEAAALAGFKSPKRKGEKLLSRKEIIAEIKKRDEAKQSSDADIEAGFRRLAFGCVSDAISLLYRDDLTAEDIAGLDLFNVSEIKKPKDGALEIKFFDRAKALERLAEFARARDGSTAQSLFDAINKSARLLDAE